MHAVSGIEGDHTLIVATGFIQPEVILGSKAIEAPILFQGIGHSVNPENSLAMIKLGRWMNLPCTRPLMTWHKGSNQGQNGQGRNQNRESAGLDHHTRCYCSTKGVIQTSESGGNKGEQRRRQAAASSKHQYFFRGLVIP